MFEVIFEASIPSGTVSNDGDESDEYWLTPTTGTSASKEWSPSFPASVLGFTVDMPSATTTSSTTFMQARLFRYVEGNQVQNLLLGLASSETSVTTRTRTNAEPAKSIINDPDKETIKVKFIVPDGTTVATSNPIVRVRLAVSYEERDPIVATSPP
jgi:hypothetical protein